MNSIIMQVILSHPTSSLVSLASRKSSKFFSTVMPSIPFLSSACNLLIRGCVSFTYLSYIPSQPIRINSSLGLLLYYLTSGLHIISCSSYARPMFFLYAKSPKLRDKFRPPSTRPLMIFPPALAIL